MNLIGIFSRILLRLRIGLCGEAVVVDSELDVRCDVGNGPLSPTCGSRQEYLGMAEAE
jgi:hypothetical protein